MISKLLDTEATCRDAKHVEWVNMYVAALDAMQAYVKEYHTAGLVWNPKVRSDPCSPTHLIH